MGSRLSSIITKTGDDGETGLGDGSRVLKSSQRVNVIGDFDEFNCHIGIVITLLDEQTQKLAEGLTWIQHKIFDAGGELAMPGHMFITVEDVHYLENWALALNQHLPRLKEFILPGGHKIVAQIHLARAVARRLERDIVLLKQSEEINLNVLHLINRLSDVLFIMARHAAFMTNTSEVLWKNLYKKH
jgi:cob(I)alamin adenosyltransferase